MQSLLDCWWNPLVRHGVDWRARNPGKDILSLPASSLYAHDPLNSLS